MDGIAWESMWHIGALLLGLVLAFAAFRYITRNKSIDRVTEQATREEYDKADREDHEVDPELPTPTRH